MSEGFTTGPLAKRASMGAKSLTYAVIFEPAENNWAAYVPDLPGCFTTGSTLEETKQNIREAIEGHIETLRQFGARVCTAPQK